jgi:hypothetical protein
MREAFGEDVSTYLLWHHNNIETLIREIVAKPYGGSFMVMLEYYVVHNV